MSDPRDRAPAEAGAPREDPRRVTQATYDVIAEDFRERTADASFGRPWLDRFAAVLGPGARVADLGAGPGRDTAELAARGLRAFALDRSLGMLRAGHARCPDRRVQGDFAALPIRSGSVEGVWANASLLHLPAEQLAPALAEIVRVLRAPGALHLTVKRGEGAVWETKRYGRARYFQYWTGEALDAALRGAGFRIEASALDRARRDVWLVRQARLFGGSR